MRRIKTRNFAERSVPNFGDGAFQFPSGIVLAIRYEVGFCGPTALAKRGWRSYLQRMIEASRACQGVIDRAADGPDAQAEADFQQAKMDYWQAL